MSHKPDLQTHQIKIAPDHSQFSIGNIFAPVFIGETLTRHSPGMASLPGISNRFFRVGEERFCQFGRDQQSGSADGFRNGVLSGQ